MKRKNSYRISCFTVAILLFLTMLSPFAVKTNAETNTNRHINESMEKGVVTDVYGADISGLSFSFINPNSRIAVVDDDSLLGRKSLSIHKCDMRIWGLNIEEPYMEYSFRVRFKESENMSFTFCITTQDRATASESIGGKILQFKAAENCVTLTDATDTFSYNLEYGTDYKIKLAITRGKSIYDIYVNDEMVGEGNYVSGIYNISACRFDADSADIILDDIQALSYGRETPQKFSMQEPGPMPEVKVPNYYVKSGLKAFINSPAGITEIDVIQQEGTAYIALDSFLTAANLNTDKGETLTKDIDGKKYISTADVNKLCGAKIWWDEAEEMIVISTDSRINDGILRSINGRFYMDGQPYYEISFNKFDLAYQITNHFFDYANGEFTEGDMLVLAEDALKTLHENGFKTIRFFCTSIVGGADILNDPERKEVYYKAFDYIFDLCEKYEIKAVPSLMLNNSLYCHAIYDPATGWVKGNETVTDMIADPNSQSRARVLEYIEEFVGRYKDRNCILMWEVSNEMNLDADVGINVNAVRNSTIQIGEFYKSVADKIRETDPVHMVTSGDSCQRNSNWNLLEGTMKGSKKANWDFDTYGERLKVLSILNEGIDAVSAHMYDAPKSDYLPTDADIDNISQPENLSFELMIAEARALGKPFYNGECGVEQSRIDQKDQEAIAPHQEQYLQQIIDAGVQLSHWWTFHSDRAASFNDDTNWNVEPGTHDKSFALIKAANEKLKATYLINKAEADNVYTAENSLLNSEENSSEKNEPINVSQNLLWIILPIVVLVGVIVAVILLKSKK